ncbi:MAG: hypothetical protein WCK63_18760 [Betaproteobacteria bacterium]
MHSGKDTVGSIIQDYTTRSSGHVKIIDGKPVPIMGPSRFTIKKWAGKLKTIASMMTGIEVERFEEMDFKMTDLGPEWDSPEGIPMTVREFLQKLGTEAIRNGLHTNAWVNALMSDYVTFTAVDKDNVMTHLNYFDWIITDTRFPNELKAVKDKGGITIQVRRGPKPTGPLHPSETALDDAEFDYVIDNNGTMEELAVKVSMILIAENIIQ